MVQIRAKQVREKVKNIDKIVKEYKKIHPSKKRDYRTYEKEFKKRLKKAIRNLERMVSDAIKELAVFCRNKDRHSLSLKKRIELILIKGQEENKGNRKMADTLELYAMLHGTDISYKSVERLYSDDVLKAALMNLFILTIKDVKNIDACGDATGYALTIKKLYSTYAQKLKEKSKEATGKKKAFVFNFSLMDLKTKKYVCYGISLKSEKEAFDKAIEMLKETDVSLKSVRLDRYYSFPCYVDLFNCSKVYIIPRKNTELGNGLKWNDTMKEFLLDTMNYLEEYFKRNNSEAGWASDKKMFGWKISQKREDRMDVALFVKMIWHNLILL